LRQSKVRQTKLGYIEALDKAKEFRLILKKKDLVYTAQHRIELRNQANEFIGLYEQEFIKFNV
jgi:tryptophan synthase beta subunit